MSDESIEFLFVSVHFEKSLTEEQLHALNSIMYARGFTSVLPREPTLRFDIPLPPATYVKKLAGEQPMDEANAVDNLIDPATFASRSIPL